MPLIVQKFGGTSVADSQKILAAARKAVRARQEGKQVVMVVSAMGHNTDLLIDLAKEITDEPPAREMDMLLSTGEQVSVALMAMAIHSLGHEAISFTGAQIGIRTDSTHTKARIQSISTDRMRAALDSGKIVIAAGFQGIDEDYNITTLGRGGSDTTAVALAAVLSADACEIFTDVRSSFSDLPGTMITELPESAEQPVGGAALVKDEARVTIQGVPDRPGTSLAIFSRIASGQGADRRAWVSKQTSTVFCVAQWVIVSLS